MNTFSFSFSKAIFLAMVIPVCVQGQGPAASSLACKDALAPLFNGEGVAWKPADAVSWKNIRDDAAKFVERDGRKGYRFACDFSRVLYHCRWDGPALELDLSGAVSLSFWVHGENADVIRRGIFYLKSGKGNYGTYFDVMDGWNCIKVNLSEMWKEGQPEGWDHVDGVRISLEKWGDGQAAATIGDVTFSVEKMEKMAFQPPKEDEALQRPIKRDAKGRLMESRVIFDEEPNFLVGGVDSVLDKVTRAGFNVYMPCIWHGRGAMYRSQNSVLDALFAHKFKGDVDPFAELIRKAHDRGVEVHGWFNVALRQAPIYPEFAEHGTPQDAFDLQNPAFRDFMVREIVEFARQYDVDGVDLDYIRTAGTSFTKTARELYRKKYNMDLEEIQNPVSETIRRFLEWQEAAVSDIVQRVHDGIRKVKPRLIISVCGEPQPNGVLNAEGRNEWLWVEKGWVDVVYDMDYRAVPDSHKLEAARRGSSHPEKFVKLLGNFEDQGPRDASLVVKQVEYFLRKYPEYGIALYLYQQLDEEQVKALREGPFKEDAVPSWEPAKPRAK